MSEGITLTPPEPVTVIEQTQVAGMVPLSREQQQQLDNKVQQFIEAVVARSVNDEQFKEKLAAIHGLGRVEIERMAGMSNRMLNRPAVAAGKMAEASPVSQSLLTLRATIEELDPSKQGGSLLEPHRLFGLIPFGHRLKAYFRRYESAQTQINAIIEGLLNGKDELAKDNAAIELEKVELWALMGRLESYVYLGKGIDTQLESRIAQIEVSDPEKARIVRDEMLFYVRQKVQDLLTQLATSAQGYLALDLIRKNNLELMKGVDRATTTTIGALRTAVMVAQALNNQKLVLDQINALNKTTGDMIAGTASMLKQQASAIGQQAASSTISLDQLKSAFNDIYATFDAMSTYKVQALKTLQESIGVLSEGMEKVKPVLESARTAATAPTSSLAL